MKPAVGIGRRLLVFQRDLLQHHRHEHQEKSKGCGAEGDLKPSRVSGILRVLVLELMINVVKIGVPRPQPDPDVNMCGH